MRFQDYYYINESKYWLHDRVGAIFHVKKVSPKQEPTGDILEELKKKDTKLKKLDWKLPTTNIPDSGETIEYEGKNVKVVGGNAKSNNYMFAQEVELGEDGEIKEKENGQIYLFYKIADEVLGMVQNKDGVKAEDYEKLIVYWYNEKIKPKINVDKLLELSGLKQDSKKYTLFTNGDNEYGKLGKQIAENIDKIGKMRHIGKSKYVPSSFWKGYKGTDRTPKTDILAEKNIRISVKKDGGSQLMSAKKDESYATFMAAADKFKKSGDYEKQIEELFGKFSNTPIKLDVKYPKIKNITQELNKILSKNWTIKDYDDEEVEKIKEQLNNTTISDVFTQTIDSKKFTEKMNQLFQNNNEFKKYLVREAMTGEKKFEGGMNDPIANRLLVFNDKGEVKLNEISDALIDTYSDKIKISSRWKSWEHIASIVIRAESSSKVIDESIDDNMILESFFGDIKDIILDYAKKGGDIIRGIYNFIIEKVQKLWKMFIEYLKKGTDNLLHLIEDVDLEDNPTFEL